MADLVHVQTQFAYHWHTTQRMIDCAAKLDQAEYTAHPGYGHGSIHDILFHILRVDRAWRRALETGQQHTPVQPADFPTLESVRSAMAEEQQQWQRLLDTLQPEEVNDPINLTNWRGEPVSFLRWRVLQQIILHGMQHHSELAQLLTAKGQSPGDIDFIFYS